MKTRNVNSTAIVKPKILKAQPKTVAIVGTHPRTRELAPYQNKGIDIWAFNSMVVQEWMPRTTACFDMHKPESYFSYEDKYKAWLYSKKDELFYTLNSKSEMPDSITYPYNPVCDTLLGNFVRGKNEDPIQYFTSGPCYAIALAIYKGYQRIEFYGIEMESNTEYIYQRDGIAFWLGLAAGRGIKVYIPDECAMFKAPRYGYDDNLTGLDWEFLDAQASALQPKFDEATAKVAAARGRMEAIGNELADAMARGESRESTDVMAQRYQTATNTYEQLIADCANLHGQYMACRNLQLYVGKQMEASGDAHRVIALNDPMKPR